MAKCFCGSDAVCLAVLRDVRGDEYEQYLCLFDKLKAHEEKRLVYMLPLPEKKDEVPPMRQTGK